VSKVLKVGVALMLVVAAFRVVASAQMAVYAEKELDSCMLFVLNAVAIAGISLGGLAKGERWAWWTLLVIVMVPPVYCVVAHGWMGWSIAGLVISTIPVAVTARPVLCAKG
jgi:hypothetical protein